MSSCCKECASKSVLRGLAGLRAVVADAGAYAGGEGGQAVGEAYLGPAGGVVGRYVGQHVGRAAGEYAEDAFHSESEAPSWDDLVAAGGCPPKVVQSILATVHSDGDIRKPEREGDPGGPAWAALLRCQAGLWTEGSDVVSTGVDILPPCVEPTPAERAAGKPPCPPPPPAPVLVLQGGRFVQKTTSLARTASRLAPVSPRDAWARDEWAPANPRSRAAAAVGTGVLLAGAVAAVLKFVLGEHNGDLCER